MENMSCSKKLKRVSTNYDVRGVGGKKKMLRGVPKLQLRYNQYHHKDIDEMNPTTKRKATNGDHGGPHMSPKGCRWFTCL